MSSKNVIWCLASEISLYEEQTTFAPDLLLANYLVLGRREGFTMIVHRTSSVSSPITLHLGCDRIVHYSCRTCNLHVFPVPLFSQDASLFPRMALAHRADGRPSPGGGLPPALCTASCRGARCA